MQYSELHDYDKIISDTNKLSLALNMCSVYIILNIANNDVIWTLPRYSFEAMPSFTLVAHEVLEIFYKT